MPGIMQQRVRKRPSHVMSEDEEHSDASSQASTGSKRARYNDRDASVESHHVATLNGHRTAPRLQNGYQNEDEYTEEEHQPGSIVRVKLQNFVTYTAAEFHPGPSLNMVIGPNGTGKSTLVCAICLGLGWDPKNLGRAKDIGEFVKHGSVQAEIEIELAAAAGHTRNPVIRRSILKENNKSRWFIDGRASTQKEVVKLAKTFSIQIDNLCQFLPQDRVVEFASLQPVALLRETLRAAAPDQMVQWHEQLKEHRAEEKRLEVTQSTEQEHLKQLQTKQDATREDVQRWNQRQELVQKGRILEKCRPIIESRIIKREIDEIKAEKQTAKRELEQLETEVAPAREAEKEMEIYRDEVTKIRDLRKGNIDRAKRRADKFAADIKSGQDAIAEFSNQITAERDGEKRRRQDVKRLDGVIVNFERLQQDAPVEVDEESFQAKRKALGSKLNDHRITELTMEMRSIHAQAGKLKQTLQQKINERAALDTQSGQQANLLLRTSRDTAAGWDWIQNNRDGLQLKGEVYGPPILTCSVTDPRYADAVEAQLGGQGDATAITFTNGDDQRLISNELLGKQGLHGISLRTVNKPLSFYRSPVTREELTNYGFDGWILDYIQGPEPVLAMLCDQAQFHRAAYTPKQLSGEQHHAIEQSQIMQFIVGREKYRITRRREYNATSTRVISVPKAKYFTDQPVDFEHKRAIDNEIMEKKREMAELSDQHNICKEKRDKLTQESEQAKAERDELTVEQDRKRKARAEWEAIPAKKAEKVGERESLQALMRETSQRILRVKAKSEKEALKVASLAIEYARAISALRQVHEEFVEAEIRLVEASSEVESLKAENVDIQQAINARRAVLKELDARKKSLTHQYNSIVRMVAQVQTQLSDEEREYMQEWATRPTMEDLDNEIEATNAKLEMMADGNPNAVKAYENREQEIERTQEKLDKIAEELQTRQDEITKIRDVWEPRLDELVATISDRFSHNFAQIGCAGQVGVYKDEDFENWAIQIQVRFRENESLSILDSHRQSGGERAVSTIFYLMALQDLARAPFRVVDEINQGMDPRNERMVHERMVDIACREGTSQYFLITPKLLNDLKFHPKMKIHCIASGEHMPDQYQKLDFQKLADMAIRKKIGR